MTNLQRELERLGLSENESIVYLCLLELGEAKTKDVAAKAKINRPAVYLILESLHKKGLVNVIEDSNISRYSAEHPKQLELLLQSAESRLNEQKVILHDLEPELASLFHHTSNRPAVKIYTGKEGFIAMDKDSMRNRRRGRTALSFTAFDKLGKFNFDKDRTYYTKKRMLFREPLKVIYTNKSGPIAGANSEKDLREARYLPSKRYPFQSSIVIRPWYGLRIFSEHQGEFLGITIASKEIAKTMEAIFKIIWDTLE